MRKALMTILNTVALVAVAGVAFAAEVAPEAVSYTHLTLPTTPYV
jgi:F-type H+-transporting ATPase subunit c